MLREQIQQDLKDALRAGDERRKATLRFLMAGLRNAEIDLQHELSDTEVQAVIAKQVKQRRESIEEFRKAGRMELVEKESEEMAILAPYMPQQLSREEIAGHARRVIEQTGASGPADKGKVMSVIMNELRGRADGREINEVVTELLKA